MDIVTLHLVNTIITFVGWILVGICCNSSNSTTYTDILWLLLTSTIMASGLDALVMHFYRQHQDRKAKDERMALDDLYVYLKDKPVIDAGYDNNSKCHLSFKVTSATNTFIGGTKIEWKMNESICGKKVKGTAQLIRAKGNILFVINYCDDNGNGFGIPNKVIETIASELGMTTKYDINDDTTYSKYFK